MTSTAQSKKITVLPSFPASNFDELENLVETLKEDIGEFQIDIADGEFSPFSSWPFNETKSVYDELSKISSLPKSIAYGVDMMVMNPEKYFSILKEVGVERVLIHVGSTKQPLRIIKEAKALGFKVAIAFTNGVSRELVLGLLPSVDFSQVMGIREVGKQGQPFDERTIDTLVWLRNLMPELEICVDGSVNQKTIPALVRAGANRLAPGSAVAKSDDPKLAYKQLSELAEQSNNV